MFWHRIPFLLDNICGALSVLQNLGWPAACLARLTDPICWPDWSACGADCFACLTLLLSSNFVGFRCDSINFSFGWFWIIRQSTCLDASLSCGFTCLTTSVARDLRYRILVGLAWLGLVCCLLGWPGGLACWLAHKKQARINHSTHVKTIEKSPENRKTCRTVSGIWL